MLTPLPMPSGVIVVYSQQPNSHWEPLAMELEIELTEELTPPSLVTQSNGSLRLTFHWGDEIRSVLELVTHPLRGDVEDGFLQLWSCDESSRSFEQVNETTVLIRSKQTS